MQRRAKRSVRTGCTPSWLPQVISGGAHAEANGRCAAATKLVPAATSVALQRWRERSTQAVWGLCAPHLLPRPIPVRSWRAPQAEACSMTSISSNFRASSKASARSRCLRVMRLLTTTVPRILTADYALSWSAAARPRDRSISTTPTLPTLRSHANAAEPPRRHSMSRARAWPSAQRATPASNRCMTASSCCYAIALPGLCRRRFGSCARRRRICCANWRLTTKRGKPKRSVMRRRRLRA